MWIVFYFMLVMRSREDLEEMRWEAMRYKNIFFSLSYFEQRRPWKREKTGGPQRFNKPGVIDSLRQGLRISWLVMTGVTQCAALLWLVPGLFRFYATRGCWWRSHCASVGAGFP
jgi:hypothetical protein